MSCVMTQMCFLFSFPIVSLKLATPQCSCHLAADIKYVEAQATTFICAAYGKSTKCCTSIIECRVKVWRSKTGKSGASLVNLYFFLPTTAAFMKNVHMCHLQVTTWKAALLESPPAMDPTKYGWEVDNQGILLPPTVPHDTLSAPPDILTYYG